MTAEEVNTLYERWQDLTEQMNQVRQTLVDLENAANDAYRAFYFADMAEYKEQNK